MTAKPQKIYPKPDWWSFAKASTGMALSLAFLHWAPEVAVWAYAKLGKPIVINESRMEFILAVAYLMCGVAFVLGLAGLLWSTWHYPARKSYERDRADRLSKSIDTEVAERLNEMERRRK